LGAKDRTSVCAGGKIPDGKTGHVPGGGCTPELREGRRDNRTTQQRESGAEKRRTMDEPRLRGHELKRKQRGRRWREMRRSSFGGRAKAEADHEVTCGWATPDFTLVLDFPAMLD
jgi:hypothetical protein